MVVNCRGMNCHEELVRFFREMYELEMKVYTGKAVIPVYNVRLDINNM